MLRTVGWKMVNTYCEPNDYRNRWTVSDLKSMWLFTDGGVILKNPSPYGGSAAYIIVKNAEEVERKSWYLEPRAKSGVLTNNDAELDAAIEGILRISEITKESFNLATDSIVTVTRLAKEGYGSGFIPESLDKKAKARFAEARQILRERYTSIYLVGGHPTRKELLLEENRKGFPVSKFNVECDSMCRKINEEVKERVRRDEGSRT